MSDDLHVSDPPPVRWVEVARWCAARDGGRRAGHEAAFLIDLDRRGDVDLSPRQAAWLATIYAELRLEDEPAPASTGPCSGSRTKPRCRS